MPQMNLPVLTVDAILTPVVITGPIEVTQGTSPWVVSGTVDIDNFPSSFGVTQDTSPWVVSGTVAVSNFPSSFGVTQGTSPWVVSGTVSAAQSGTWNINNISGVVSLPTGAATEATLAGVLTTSAFQARINTLGQKTMTNSTPVTLASDQTALPVSQSGTWSTGRTWALSSGSDSVSAIQGTSPWVVSGTVTPGTASSGALTTLTKSTSSQVAIASNASRKGFLLWNNTTAIAYVGFGFTPTTSSFSIRLVSNTGYEPAGPSVFSGAVNVIWGSSGGAETFNSTEFT